MTKKESALERIRIEYATYGKATQESVRAYIENHISYKLYIEAIKKGMKQYNEKIK